MRSEVYLALGSNLGDREANISSALEMLSEVSTGLTVSSLYETSPRGFSEQPAFLNACCRLWTSLDPFQLMDRLSAIEVAVGRRRLFPNAPRELDVDILTYGRRVIETLTLSVPHPRMAERGFVLVPLAELAPGLAHPVLGETIRVLLDRLPGARDGIRPVRSRLPSRNGSALGTSPPSP